MIAFNVLTHIFGRPDPVSTHATLIKLNWEATRVHVKVNNLKSKHIVACVWEQAGTVPRGAVRGRHNILP